MKTSPRLLALLLLPALVSLPEGSAWSQQRDALPELKSARVTERGSHHAKWETVQEVADPISGETVSVTNSYVQLETGLHYQDERGEWQESSEEIEVQPGAAVARRGPHQVRWAANLNTHGAIEFWTPEGEGIRSHVLGLAYFDPATGAHVMIGEVQDSVGAVAGNQVIYEDAFDGVSADLHYTYTKGGFVQDVIVREKLPDPALWGFDPATVQVQVLTEFVTLPDELKELARITAEASAATNTLTGSFEAAYAEDQALNFGSMAMTEGRAFGVEDTAQERAVPVRKTLQLFEGGRNILLETLDYGVMEPELETLPELSKPTASLDRKSSGQQTASLRVAPPAPTRQWAAVEAATDADQAPLLMARAELPAGRNGYVIDYNLSGSTNNLTLQGDTTYYVTGQLSASGTTTIEGGTVVKFANTNSARITLSGAIKCLTDLYRPAIFTAKDDNVVGTTISGSTGNPSGYYAVVALGVAIQPSTHLKHLQIRHATIGIQYSSAGGYPHRISHSQIGSVQRAVECSTMTYVDLRNVLIHGATFAFFRGGDYNYATAEHVTFNNVEFIDFPSPPLASVALTNCLLVNVPYPGSYSGSGNATESSASGVLQAVGTGGHYLVGGSTHRNAGVTNISRQLKLELKKFTTFPPVIITNGLVTANTTLTPVVQRDTDVPDRGFHYPAIDYALATHAVTNATLTLAQGVKIAFFGTTGFWLQDHANLVSEGTPDDPNVLTRYSFIHEQPANWGTAGTLIMIHPYRYSGASGTGTIALKFTHLILGTFGYYTYVDGGNWRVSSLLVENCELYGGGLNFDDSTITCTLRNNLLHRGHVETTTNPTFNFHNNTFFSGSFIHVGNGTGSTFKDNLFDRSFLIFAGTNQVHSHNAYVTGQDRIPPNQGSDVILSAVPAYETGPLGYFHHPIGSPLINAGSRNATNAGLYHFTIRLDQLKETNSVVDIGYHYAALDWPNLALNKTATQSSTYPSAVASRAVDGNTDGNFSNNSVSSTSINTNAWWQLDIGQVHPVELIQIWNRTDCCSTRLSNFYTFASEAAFTSSDLTTTLFQSGVNYDYHTGAAGTLTSYSPEYSGRYFRVQLSGTDYLSLAEVRIFGTAKKLFDTDGDGIPDYLEDANGNGAHDAGAGETNWQSYDSPSGLGAGPAVQLYTPLRN